MPTITPQKCTALEESMPTITPQKCTALEESMPTITPQKHFFVIKTLNL
jgi:hypothetical protein